MPDPGPPGRDPGIVGLVLSGGGARGAYQAGVSRALGEIARGLGLAVPFRALAGVSAGAINATFLAAHAHDLAPGARQLCDLWTSLRPEQVFRTDPLSLGVIGSRWARALSLGPIVGGQPPQALLDTSPLKKLLDAHLPLAGLRDNVARRVIEGVAVTATDYASIHTVTFYASGGRVAPWHRRRRIARETDLRPEHVMASAAIPLFFAPVEVAGSFFGDGCLRNQAPLSPAIHLGAERLVVVGVRRRPSPQDDQSLAVRPTLARILSVLLNSMFFDAVDYDVERLQSINRTLALHGPSSGGGAFKPIRILTVQPSEDLGLIARDEFRHLPRVLRYLLRGMGTPDEASEIVSYLLFESSYTSRLVELGHADTIAMRADVESLLLGTPAPAGA